MPPPPSRPSSSSQRGVLSSPALRFTCRPRATNGPDGVIAGNQPLSLLGAVPPRAPASEVRRSCPPAACTSAIVFASSVTAVAASRSPTATRDSSARTRVISANTSARSAPASRVRCPAPRSSILGSVGCLLLPSRILCEGVRDLCTTCPPSGPARVSRKASCVHPGRGPSSSPCCLYCAAGARPRAPHPRSSVARAGSSPWAPVSSASSCVPPGAPRIARSPSWNRSRAVLFAHAGGTPELPVCPSPSSCRLRGVAGARPRAPSPRSSVARAAGSS